MLLQSILAPEKGWVTKGLENVIFTDKIMRIDQKVTNGHEIGIQRQERKAWTLGTHRGKEHKNSDVRCGRWKGPLGLLC